MWPWFSARLQSQGWEEAPGPPSWLDGFRVTSWIPLWSNQQQRPEGHCNASGRHGVWSTCGLSMGTVALSYRQGNQSWGPQSESQRLQEDRPSSHLALPR